MSITTGPTKRAGRTPRLAAGRRRLLTAALIAVGAWAVRAWPMLLWG